MSMILCELCDTWKDGDEHCFTYLEGEGEICESCCEDIACEHCNEPMPCVDADFIGGGWQAIRACEKCEAQKEDHYAARREEMKLEERLDAV